MRTPQKTKKNTRGSAAATRELAIELDLTKRRLQTTMDEYETSQEEMRASNEELQSANEELRSTLEELETSKEELQSINEELQTANQENRHRMAELSQLTDDLQHLMTATHIATLFLDRKMRILRFTPQIGELFNLRAVDRGRPLSDLTHHLHYDDLIADANRVLDQLVPSEREVEDEKGNWYIARMRPYRTADDHIDGLVLTFVDITARKKSEIALRQSEERYRMLFESMDEGFCVAEQKIVENGEQDIVFVEANPAFMRLAGLPNLAGQSLARNAPAQLSFWNNIYNELGNQDAPACFECTSKKFERWVQIYSFPLPNNAQGQVAILLKDIHEQKLVEQELREASQRDAFRVALADAIRSSRDPQDIQKTSCRMLAEYLQVNTATYYEFSADGKMLTEQRHSRFTENFKNFYPWENNETYYANFIAGKVICVGNSTTSSELTPVQKDLCQSIGLGAFVTATQQNGDYPSAALSVFSRETRTWSEAEISLIKEVAERTSSATERANAERAIRQREVALQAVDQRKNEFLAVLSHELRNPLAPILNALHIIESSASVNEESAAAHTIMRRQVGLLSRLIDDLLDITRIARGKIQLRNDRLELNKLLRLSLEDHASIFQKNDVTIEFSPAPEDVWVDGDENRLAQAIGNLLQNCAKFTGPGGLTTISLSLHEVQAIVRVTDSGIGMSPELIEQLFQPFVQGEATLERSKGGLGLGLALSKRLIELHNGNIVAYSAGYGEGSVFEIHLPLATAPTANAADKQITTTSARSVRRVLVIEDNVDSANTLRDLLRMSDHEVEVAYDGPTGVELARKFLPDIVVCDIGLPGADGYEVARSFKADNVLRNIVLVALSGYAMPQDLDRATTAGFDFHLAKPANISRLREIFSSCKTADQTEN